MNYKKIDMGSYQLHLISTDRFKTILTRVCLRDNFKKLFNKFFNIFNGHLSN